MDTSSASDIRRRPHRTRRGASGGRRFRRAFLAIQAPPGDALNNFLQARRYARPPQVRGLGRLRCMAAAVVAKLIAVRRRMPAAAAATRRGTKRPRHSASKSITKRYQRRNSTAHRCGRGFAAGSFAFKPRRSNSRAAADRLGIIERGEFLFGEHDYQACGAMLGGHDVIPPLAVGLRDLSTNQRSDSEAVSVPLRRIQKGPLTNSGGSLPFGLLAFHAFGVLGHGFPSSRHVEQGPF